MEVGRLGLGVGRGVGRAAGRAGFEHPHVLLTDLSLQITRP